MEQCAREQKELDTQKQLANQQLAQLEQQKVGVTKEIEKLQQQYQMECTVVCVGVINMSCDPLGYFKSRCSS